MNRLVCERKVNDPVDCLLEVKEQSSRTHGGVRGSPHQSLLVGQSTRLGAGVLVFRVCKPLSLLSFSVLFLVVLVCAVAYFLFLEGREIFLIQFSCVGFASSLTKLWSVLGLVRLWQCACKLGGLSVDALVVDLF